MSWNGFDIDAALSTIGSVLVIGGLVSFFFENFAKRVFFEEIFTRITKSTEIFRGGIEECYEHSSEISYRENLNSTKSITTLFAYSDGFIKKYENEIEIAAKRNASIRFIFVKEDSPAISAMLQLGWQKSSIDANYENIRALMKKLEPYKNVTFNFVEAIPRYAAVMFDQEVFVVEHTTAFGRSAVPALRLNKLGYLGKFYIADIEKLIEEGR